MKNAGPWLGGGDSEVDQPDGVGAGLGGDGDEEQRLGAGARKRWNLAKTAKSSIYSKSIGPGWCYNPGLMPPFSPGWCHQPGPKAPMLPASGPKFSPTSLVERGMQWFISPTVAPLSSSSPPQAFGPTCYCFD